MNANTAATTRPGADESPPGTSTTSAAWRGPNGVRNQALQRDNHTCQHCGRPATHVHHVVAIAECEAAGIDVYDLDNLASVCAACSGRADAARSHDPRPSAILALDCPRHGADKL
jgi:5-methylcytosine-specific restriction endonuclease McrA